MQKPRISLVVCVIAIALMTTSIFWFYGENAGLIGRVGKLENDKSALVAQIEGLQDQIDNLENNNTLLQRENENLQAENAHVRAPWSSAWLTFYLPVPREIDQATFFQTVENLSVASNALSSGTATLIDEYGNTFMALYWNEKQTSKIVATIESVILREVGMVPVNTPDLYPIPEDLLHENVSVYLQPTQNIQSDDPAIVSLAQNLSQGFTKEVDVVNNTLKWISENIEWGCPACIANYSSDAVWTLKNKEGNCVNFAHLMVALFRAQGIPARLAKGIKGYEHSNPGYLTPVNGSNWHAWTEIYYPQVGWVRYDATYFPHSPHIAYGIQLKVLPNSECSTHPLYDAGDSRFKEITTEWEIVGLGGNKVRLIYTFTAVPED